MSDLAATGQTDRPAELPSVTARLLLAGRIAGGIAVLIGAAVLTGYATQTAALVRLAPSLPPMYPNAAIAFAAGGAAALLLGEVGRWPQRFAFALAAVVIAIGAAGLWLHVTGAPAGWYEALWPGDGFVAATTAIGGRPVAETCVALVLVGAALATMASGRAPLLAQGLALGSATIGLTALIGYVVGVDRTALGGSLATIGMALPTALALTALGIAALLARPAVGLLRIVTDAGPGGRLGRRLLVVVLLGPIALATVVAISGRFLEDSDLAQSVIAVSQVAILGGLVLLPVAVIERFDWREVVSARDERRRREAAADAGLADQLISADLQTRPVAPPGWQLEVCQEPAEGFVAGDSQQVLHRGDRCLVAVVDVAGHGTPAGLLALRLRAEIAALWSNELDLEAIAATLNRSVAERASTASAVLVDLDVTTGRGRFVNAGHPPPVHVHRGGSSRWNPTGPILGLAGGRHRSDVAEIHPGDVVVLFTDGVTEARDGGGHMLGDESIVRLIRRRAAEGTQPVARACVDAALAHTGRRLADDTLVLAVRRS